MDKRQFGIAGFYGFGQGLDRGCRGGGIGTQITHDFVLAFKGLGNDGSDLIQCNFSGQHLNTS